jgi:hypothetical protein
LELPGTPLNGHAAGVPSYVKSQALKEYHLSQLRGIEVDIKRRELYPLHPLRAICFTALNRLRTRSSVEDARCDPVIQARTERVMRWRLSRRKDGRQSRTAQPTTV